MRPLKKFLIFIVLGSLISCSETKTEIPAPKRDFCSGIHRNDSTRLSKELAPLDELMQSKTGVYVLEDGGGAMITRACRENN